MRMDVSLGKNWFNINCLSLFFALSIKHLFPILKLCLDLRDSKTVHYLFYFSILSATINLPPLLNTMFYFLFFLFSFFLSANAEPSWISTPDIKNTPHWSVPIRSHEDRIRQSSPYADVITSPQDRKIGIHLSQYAIEAIPRIAKELGVSTGGPLQIYVAESQKEFLSMQPNVPPDWADGTAWPKNGWIFLRSPRIRSGVASPLTQVLDHEIVHILLGRAFAHRPVPRWLQEGVAQFVAREYSPETVEQLGSFASPIALNQLAKGFPKGRFQAQMAYAQSADVIAFIFREYGLEALQILIKEMSSGQDFDFAMVKATGLTPEELDIAWQGETFSMPLWLRNLSIDSTLLAVIGLVILLGASRKYKQLRQANLEWEYEEQVHQQLIKEMASWQSPTFRF